VKDPREGTNGNSNTSIRNRPSAKKKQAPRPTPGGMMGPKSVTSPPPTTARWKLGKIRERENRNKKENVKPGIVTLTKKMVTDEGQT